VISRRQVLRVGFGGVLSSLAALVAGCGGGAVVSSLAVSATTIVPDGSGIHDEADVTYTLYKRAEVGVRLIGPDGKQSVIRDPQLRAPDQYQIPFRGVIPVPGTNWLRVVPNGVYQFVVDVRDVATGQITTRQASIAVQSADTTPPEITNVVVNPTTFSPNGDGIDDTVTVSYRLSKDSQFRVYATDAAGGFYLIQAPQKVLAALHSFEWDGKTASGDQVLKDGNYTLHLEATDLAGNFSDVTAPIAIQNGGTPRAEITDVRFSPTALALGMDLAVHITVKNTGDVPLRTLGPPPGTKYDTNRNFASFTASDNPNAPKYYERVGVWRACVSWQNAPEEYPVRWGFFPETDPTKPVPDRALMPGESVTIDGTITVLVNTPNRTISFWAGLEQGGVGFPTVQVGQTTITVSH
jgi:hypothetical protein